MFILCSGRPRAWYTTPRHDGWIAACFIDNNVKFSWHFTITTGDLVTEGTWRDAWWDCWFFDGRSELSFFGCQAAPSFTGEFLC